MGEASAERLCSAVKRCRFLFESAEPGVGLCDSILCGIDSLLQAGRTCLKFLGPFRQRLGSALKLRGTFGKGIQSFADSAEALQDGQIDAAFIVAGAPTSAVTSLAASHDVSLVSLDDEHIDALIESSPFYAKAVIDADTYGMKENVSTVAVSAVVIAGNDVADVDVYNFLCGVFENLEDLAKVHDKANELSLEFASSFSGVPYHAGAVQYFADKGIEVPAE